MVKGKRWARLLAGVAVLALVSAACGDGGGTGKGPDDEGLTGSITISGIIDGRADLLARCRALQRA